MIYECQEELIQLIYLGSKTLSTQSNCICSFRYAKILRSLFEIILSTIPWKNFNNCSCCRSVDI